MDISVNTEIETTVGGETSNNIVVKTEKKMLWEVAEKER